MTSLTQQLAEFFKAHPHVQIGAAPKPQCRTCIHWKRRVSMIGECWEHEQIATTGWPANVFASDSCPEWTPKVVKA